MLDELFKKNEEVQMIVFSLGKEQFAVPITSVQEIILPPEMTSIPKAPDFIEGVINLRGAIVPIIHTCKRFNIPNAETDKNDKRIIILDMHGQTLGVIVNDVSEVINISKNSVDNKVTEIADNSDFFWGVAKVKDKLLILINPEELLDLSERESLMGIGQVIDNIKTAVKVETVEVDSKKLEEPDEIIKHKTTSKEEKMSKASKAEKPNKPKKSSK